jgi:stage V sporulation protein G
MLKFEVIRLHKLDNISATKALVDVSVEDSIIINGIRVVEGTNGLFISMPREETRDGKWYNVVVPLRREVKDEIERVVIEAYNS